MFRLWCVWCFPRWLAQVIMILPPRQQYTFYCFVVDVSLCFRRMEQCYCRHGIVAISQSLLGIPAPNLSQVFGHVDTLRAHFHHPRVLEHPPWARSPCGFLLKALAGQHMISYFTLVQAFVTYQHSMKYLKLSLQKMLASGSSLSFGIGCRTM